MSVVAPRGRDMSVMEPTTRRARSPHAPHPEHSGFGQNRSPVRGWWRKGGVAAVILAAIALIGCSDNAAVQKDLDAGRTLWDSRGPSTYTIAYQRFALVGNAGSFVARVENGSVTSVEPATGLGGTEEMPTALTVERLFDLVQDAIDRGADRIEVDYDTEYGYPRNIRIDDDTSAADDELTLTAELQPLQPD